LIKRHIIARRWWFMPVILATQEAQIISIKVQSQPKQIARETPSQKKPSQKRAGIVAQGVGPEFKCSITKQTNKQKN
jgi:hypothetical protein